ncbi:hypothetical protein CapIbe_017483 [Capra ibex]
MPMDGDQERMKRVFPAAMATPESTTGTPRPHTRFQEKPSLQLDHLHTGSLHTSTHKNIRDTHNSTGSQDSPRNNPSSSTSRQDSLHKAPKKGIKSSISRLFRKKKKGRPEHPGKETLAPGRIFTPSTTWKAPVNADN